MNKKSKLLTTKNKRYSVRAETDRMLNDHFKSYTGEYPDFARMAQQAIAAGNFKPTVTAVPRSRVNSWYRIAKRVAFTTAALFVVTGLLKVSFYVAPRWQQFAYAAIQPVPIAGDLVSLQDVGLKREIEKGNVQAHHLTDTVNGFCIDLLATYADSNRTVIFFRLFPPADNPTAEAGSWTPKDITLVDQFGLRHSNSYGIQMSPDNKEGMIELPAVPSWVRALGVRFHLEIGAVEWSTNSDTPHFTEKSGPWTMNWIQEWQTAERTIYPAITASSSEVQFNLEQVTLAPSSTRLIFTVDFHTANSNGNKKSEGKPDGDEMYLEKVSDGTRYDFLSSGFTTGLNDKSGKGDILFPPVEDAGDYQFVVKRINGIEGDWVLPFTVPTDMKPQVLP